MTLLLQRNFKTESAFSADVNGHRFMNVPLRVFRIDQRRSKWSRKSFCNNLPLDICHLVNHSFIIPITHLFLWVTYCSLVEVAYSTFLHSKHLSQTLCYQIIIIFKIIPINYNFITLFSSNHP